MTISDKIKVLLVEDNPADAVLIEEYLSDAPEGDFALQTAARLDAALDVLAQDEIDVVLLDLRLPDSKGLDTVAQVMAAAPGMPVVVLTGMDDVETGLQAIRLGIQDYLVKGRIDNETISRTLHYAIDRQSTFNLLADQLGFQQQIVDAMPVPMFCVDRDQVIIGCNTAFGELIGHSYNELFGSSVFESLPEPMAAPFDLDTSGEDQHALPAEDRVEFLDAAGATRRMTMKRTPLVDAQDRSQGVVVVLV